MATSLRSPQHKIFLQGIPPILRPVLRAYVLGYASSTTPRLLTLFLTYLGRKRKRPDDSDQPEVHFILSVLRILKGGLEFQRFPTFCAALVGGSTLLELPLKSLLERVAKRLSNVAQFRLSKWISAFIAGWFSFKLLQSKKSEVFVDNVVYNTQDGRITRPTFFAGRTMDLTLFAVTRALDVIVGELWTQRKQRRTAGGTWTKLDRLISNVADPAVFAASSALIMWAWIYSPDRLPRSYNKWIKSAAAVDPRLVTALRKMRYGEMKYGLETGHAYVLQDMCKDYGWPLEFGDPVESIPFPCEVVHMGCGESCEYHAVSRFVRSFVWAISSYLPLNLILIARNPSAKGLKHAIKTSVRSSAFLGAFITLFYYGICLTRTRVGPQVLGKSVPVLNQIDSGLCICGGCSLCGWSVLIENAGRRKELGLFVAPRALATLMPRRYLMEDQWKETLAFAMSTAVVFTCVSEKPERVRGVLGKLLQRVMVK